MFCFVRKNIPDTFGVGIPFMDIEEAFARLRKGPQLYTSEPFWHKVQKFGCVEKDGRPIFFDVSGELFIEFLPLAFVRSRPCFRKQAVSLGVRVEREI